MSKKRYVVGNWKMYMESPAEATKFAKALRAKTRAFARSTGLGQAGVEAWVAPSFPLITPVAAALGVSATKKQTGAPIKLGAQTLSVWGEGAHTGDVSAKILKNLGCSFVIVGHSERRAMGESDETIRAQLLQAASAGLVSILCVGERERLPDGSHFQEVANQLGRALHDLKPAAGKLLVAYEPVWAIGKSAADAMRAEEVEEMAIFIRKILAETLGREAANKVPILYGGSVEPANASTLINDGGVSGFLVGHASADVNSFIEILTSCKK